MTLYANSPEELEKLIDAAEKGEDVVATTPTPQQLGQPQPVDPPPQRLAVTGVDLRIGTAYTQWGEIRLSKLAAGMIFGIVLRAVRDQFKNEIDAIEEIAGLKGVSEKAALAAALVQQAANQPLPVMPDGLEQMELPLGVTSGADEGADAEPVRRRGRPRSGPKE